LVVVSTGDGSAGIGVDDGRLAVRWESDAVVSSALPSPSAASPPLAIAVGEGLWEPSGVIDLDSGEVHPFEGEPRSVVVARDGELPDRPADPTRSRAG
jgi:hypothetical protein